MRILSRRSLEQLCALQGALRRLAGERNAALRLFAASRGAATPEARREFWLEYAWLDQEYRHAVRRIREFCAAADVTLLSRANAEAVSARRP
jgi:hypothetical protein